MKNRFSKMGNALFGTMCLLSACGLTYSCSDDYDLDETMPDFLGGSIYDELKGREFNTTVKLIDDLNYREVLSKTGSKTLFVANEEAYKKFFATTTWKDGNGNYVRDYNQLSAAQKSLLLYGAMLNNADVVEMLPYSSDGGSLTMRRGTASTAVDSVPYWKWNELPENLNVGELDGEGNNTGDPRFWDKYRQPGREGIYMALDASSPMMTHFIEDNLKVKNVLHSDISFIMNNKDPWENGSAGGNRTYIYGSRIVERDVTCMNGYFNVLDSVLITPPNMAEVIRTNGKTNLFSKMLDRFSAPYYNASLTAQYKALHDIGNDSVFEKRYISTRSASSVYSPDGSFTQTPDLRNLGDYPFLAYDPGWNEYRTNSAIGKEQDMGAMFVPTDKAIIDYFVYGGGRGLMDRYALRENNEANIEYNLYQIPLTIIQALINNLMKDSFLETVPSKYLTIMNDAQDQMFPASNEAYASEEKYKQNIEECLMANNGVVYVMNRVITPADYASVIAPALYNRNTQIMRTVARADDNCIDGNLYNAAPLKKYYSTYLKAMQSRFSFFVPTDDALGSTGLLDPMSIARGAGGATMYRYWRYGYKNVNVGVGTLPLTATAYVYNPETGQQPDDPSQASKGIAGSSLDAGKPLTLAGPGLITRSMLIELMDQHIVVHNTDDADNNMGVNGKRTYFQARNGAPVHIVDKGDVAQFGLGMVVEGGLQVQMNQDEFPQNDNQCHVTQGFDMTQESNGYGNGMTYLLDRAMQPTTKSIYAIFNGNENYSEFFNCCTTQISPENLILAGFQTEEMAENEAAWRAEQRKYQIFVSENSNASNGPIVHPALGEQLVRFLNNYRYTVYAPTNAAMQEAYAKGLMTPTQINEFIQANLIADEEGNNVLSPENQIKAKGMIVALINFLKYHFQDETLYVDNVTTNGAEYQTSCIDTENNVYLTLYAKQTPNAITVTDNNGETQDVVAPYNVLARDAHFNTRLIALDANNPASSISSSSFVVIHQINKPLSFMDLKDNGGRFDVWNKPANEVKAFVKKYQLR